MEVTKQEVFNAAWNGLKAQGFVRSVNREGQAVGCGINNTYCALVHAWHSVKCHEASRDCGSPFLMGLRYAHDEADSPDDMERRLREFAAKNALAIPNEPNPFPAFMDRVLNAKIATPEQVRATALLETR